MGDILQIRKITEVMNMSNRLKNKRCLITGASSGIGREIALSFAREGADVIVNYHSSAEKTEAEEVLESIVKSTKRALLVEADVSQPNAVNKLIGETVDFLGGIDVLVNNAGICQWHDFLTMPLEIWNKTFSTNVGSAFLCSQAAIRQMITQNVGGSIIMISSVGAYTGGVLQTHYNASKAAMISLMRSLAVAIGNYGIRANAILPGCIETNMNKDALHSIEIRRSLQNRIPLKRLGIPLDISGAAVYFASDESAYCTGTELIIDGGIFINI